MDKIFVKNNSKSSINAERRFNKVFFKINNCENQSIYLKFDDEMHLLPIGYTEKTVWSKSKDACASLVNQNDQIVASIRSIQDKGPLYTLAYSILILVIAIFGIPIFFVLSQKSQNTKMVEKPEVSSEKSPILKSDEVEKISNNPKLDKGEKYENETNSKRKKQPKKDKKPDKKQRVKDWGKFCETAKKSKNHEEFQKIYSVFLKSYVDKGDFEFVYCVQKAYQKSLLRDQIDFSQAMDDINNEWR